MNKHKQNKHNKQTQQSNKHNNQVKIQINIAINTSKHKTINKQT